MEITIKTLDQIQEGRVTIEVRGERLYTAAQVGDAQASEAELVSAPLRRRIETLEEEASLGRRQILTLGQELIGERERADKLNERNAELVAKLARVEKGHVCVETCRPNAHVAFQGRERVRELEAELDARDLAHMGEMDALRAKIREHAQSIQARDRLLREATATHAVAEAKLAEETKRADENRDWAERAEGRLAQSEVARTEAERKLADAERAIEILSGQLGRISGAVHGQELVQTALRIDWTSWSEREAAALTGAIRQVRDALGSPSPPGSPKPVTSQA